MHKAKYPLGPIAILVVSLAAGCGPSEATPPASQSQVPVQVVATSEKSPTTPAATEGPPSATPSTAPAVEPSATFPPEVIATKPGDIAGVWLLKTFVGQAGMVRFPAALTFRQDGTFSFDETDDPMHIFGGKVIFTDGKVTLDSEECYNEVEAVFYPCTITFTIYSTLQDGKPVRIRMVSAGDKGVFVTNVNNKTLELVVP
jgi:hypothetical protein